MLDFGASVGPSCITMPIRVSCFSLSLGDVVGGTCPASFLRKTIQIGSNAATTVRPLNKTNPDYKNTRWACHSFPPFGVLSPGMHGRRVRGGAALRPLMRSKKAENWLRRSEDRELCCARALAEHLVFAVRAGTAEFRPAFGLKLADYITTRAGHCEKRSFRSCTKFVFC